MSGLRIAFFGSSLVSAYWNGAATYYRGIIRALHRRGHHTRFFEPDAFERQQHRDIEDPSWADVDVYPATPAARREALDSARGADLVVKASGVGVFDQELEREVLELGGPSTLVAFWDVDAPATLERLRSDPDDPFLDLIGQYDVVFTYGGGPPVRNEYLELGARRCVPIYNALDPDIHHPVPPDPAFEGALGFLGNRLPDRESRVEEFFLRPAAALPDRRFLLGGSGWEDKPRSRNVNYLGHVYTPKHNAFNSTPRAILNISRDGMARYGFSPATRVFEAAGAAACLITDAWKGLDQFLEPEREVLVAHSGDEVIELLDDLDPNRAAAIGRRARDRLLAEHTYAHRAADVEAALEGLRGKTVIPGAPSDRPASAGGGRTGEGRSAPTLDVVVLGLSITSSWGNGHATTYRGLLREMAERGHRVTFLERDREWYAKNRDLPSPAFCRTHLYSTLDELRDRWAETIRRADLVIVGSYVPDGIEVGEWVLAEARGAKAFYDIDTPITVARLTNGGCDYLSRELVSRYDVYLSFCGGPMLRRIEQELGAPRALPLYCSFDPDAYYPESVEPRWALGYMGTYSDDRQPSVDAFLTRPARMRPDLRFAVAGPQYPESLDWPENVERIEHLPPDRHRAFYNSCRFTLNVTRRDMIEAGFSPSVRLFEASACGTPIMSDYWNGLEELFEIGKEIEVVRSSEDALQVLDRRSDAERASMAERARRRVLAEHTARRRAETLEEYAMELLDERAPSRQAS